MDDDERALADTLASWRSNPAKYLWDNWRVTPDAWQMEALQFASAPQRVKRLSMQACAGPGKTACLAWIGLLRLLYAEDGEHPRGAAVAIDRENLKANLIPELAKWMERSAFFSEFFEITADRIFCKAHPKTWELRFRGWRKDANAEEQGNALSGLHGRFPFILMDESAAIPVPVLRVAQQIFLADCRDGLIAQAGNPTTKEGALYCASVAERDRWHVIPITGDPEDPKRSSRVPIEQAREDIAVYGREDPWVMARILGQFPDSAINQLLTVEEVEEAMGRAPDESLWNYWPKLLGVDVAREGMDNSVVFPRQGLMAFEPTAYHGLDGVQGASRVIDKAISWGAEHIFVDNTGGWGGSWIDQMRVRGYRPIPIQYAAQARDPNRYFNIRTQMWWDMAQWVKGGGALPRSCRSLVGELTVPTYSHKGDRMLLQDKDRVKAILGRSPDYADALAQTFAYPVKIKTNPVDVPRWARRPARAKMVKSDEWD